MSFFKGWFGEKLTAVNMWHSLNELTYRRFHNIILPSNNGTTQIDHLIISPFGIFIIETKNKNGWIYGSADQAQWTQTFYKQKFSFQNPLRQTYRQKKVLAEFLNIKEDNIATVVYFVGDSTLKTKLPANVITSGLSTYIKSFKLQKLSRQEVDQHCNTIRNYLAKSTLTKSDHINSVRKRINSKVTCPKCGADLVERVASKGLNQGKHFLGCKNYPTCRFTRAI
ncbi:MAG: NERD domain-containing protein [Flavobacteriales bacterium]|nr:NERD domain-containing protein [Flavobacteriales bacterium]